jgi:hypothetical protein
MSLFSGFKTKFALSRLEEERLYEFILNEIESGNVRKGLMAKAISLADGNENKIQAEYIKLRLQSLIDENTVFEAIAVNQSWVREGKSPDAETIIDKKPKLKSNTNDDNEIAELMEKSDPSLALNRFKRAKR